MFTLEPVESKRFSVGTSVQHKLSKWVGYVIEHSPDKRVEYRVRFYKPAADNMIIIDALEEELDAYGV